MSRQVLAKALVRKRHLNWVLQAKWTPLGYVGLCRVEGGMDWETGHGMWPQMRQGAELRCKALHAKLGNLNLILQPREGCCRAICIWHICLGETPETERKENWQSYKLSSIYISSKAFFFFSFRLNKVCLLRSVQMTLPQNKGYDSWDC